MKKIIFFDGDGTLWYPKKTKYTKKPWWIYEHPETYAHAEEHLTTTPHLRKVLKKLKSMGVVLAVLSTQPYVSQHERDANLMRLIEHLNLEEFFDEIHGSKIIRSKNDQQTKGMVILKVLKRTGIAKSNALMVGDLYGPDYRDVKRVGVDSVLVGYFKYNENDPRYKRVKRRIPNLSGIFKYLGKQ
jgi:magnesium-dependent phosphatase-1